MQDHAHAKLSGKRLVIFGCGYVGSEVARRAQALGLRVTALTRNAEKALRLRGDGITVVQAELAETTWHDQLRDGADFVLNSVSSGGGGVEGYRRSYRDGMASILAWAKRHPVGTLVYTSSTSVYAQGDGSEVTEDSPVEARSDTAAVLIETEELLRQAGSSVCARWFILRLAGIYGPERHSLLDQLRGGAREISGRGEHRLNLIYRDDAAEAVLSAFAAPADVPSNIFNLADGRPAAKAEVAGWLATQLGVPAPTFAGVATPSRRGLVPDRTINAVKVARTLGWQPAFPDYQAGYEKILSL